MGRAWPALDIYVPGCDPQLQELVLAELDDFQPTALHEPDDSSRLRAFFTSAESRDAAARALAASFGIHLLVDRIDVEDDDWAARSQSQLRAITIGKITVAPPWDVPGSDPRTVRGSDVGGTFRGEGDTVRGSDPVVGQVVIIQPSMGFGTGHHATTRLALRALQALPLQNQSVLDIGCGSGVLAIAAVKLGAQSAAGIDIDPDAVENASDNAALNDVKGQVRFDVGDFRELTATATIVIANLTGALLERSAAKLCDLVSPEGFLIVSGFMDSETPMVLAALEQFLAVQSIAQEEEWTCAVLGQPHKSRQM